MIRKEAWPFYRTISGVRLYWVLEEPKGPEVRSSIYELEMLVVEVKWEGGSKSMRMLFISAVALGVLVGETAALNAPASQVSHSATGARTAPSAEAPSMHLRGLMDIDVPMLVAKVALGFTSVWGGLLIFAPKMAVQVVFNIDETSFTTLESS